MTRMDPNRIDAENLSLEATRTVQSVYLQFEELKQSAASMLEHIDHLGRDYLTPSEDEQTRRLLLTYWQLRLALLEVVHDLRDRGTRNLKTYHQLFLPGYAGALVLLDSARALREMFHHRPVIRRKLNEAEPSFKIPAGVYDQTQASWTLPKNLWMLFDAARYYHRRRHRWNKLAQTNELKQMVSIIDQLSARLNISWSGYAKTRLRFRVRQLWSLLRGNFVGSAMFQIQKVAGVLAADKYLKRGHQPGLPKNVRNEFAELLAPGDILLVRKEYALTNYFLPGYWPHSALYVGSLEYLERAGLREHPSVSPRWKKIVDCGASTVGRVLEAMKDGVYVRSLASVCRSDSFLVIRPKLSSDSIQHVVARALFHEGKEYDFSFDFTVADRLVCTEVIYRALDGVSGISFPLSRRAGRMTLAAEDIVRMAMQAGTISIEAAFIPTLSGQILCQTDAYSAVCKVATSLSTSPPE